MSSSAEATEAAASPGGRHAPSRARAYRWVLSLLVLGALIVAWRGFGQERRFAEVVRNAEPAWLLGIVLLQLATYPSLAWAWSRSIAGAGAAAPSMRSLVGISLAELFTDQALPSAGVGGMVFVVAALRRRDVPAPAAASAVVTSMLGFYSAQLLGVVVAFASLLVRHRFVHFAAATAVVALLAAAAIPTVAIAIAAGGLPHLPRRLRRIRLVGALRDAVTTAPRDVVFSPSTLGPVTASRVGIVFLDSATLAAAMAAVGHPVALDAAVTAFVLASIVGSISFLPGGLGTFEAVATAMLAIYGAPIEAAVPAIFLHRGFTFWLPMLPGLWFARHELRTRGPA